MQTNPILVIGATGKTGARVARKLTERGCAVRDGSRRSSTPFDWDKPHTWPAALAGSRAAYVSYFPDLAYPGAEGKIEALSRAAATADVRRLVLLSGRGEYHAKCCEDIVRDSGLEYTLVRAAWFAQNFSEGYLREPALDGVVALPAGDVREPFVDVEDVADVAVAALTEDRHVGQLYEVTGPELLSFDDVAQMLSAAMHRAVRYRSITFEAFHAAMTPIGGEVIADVITRVCRETLDGRNALLGDGVQRALGRGPRSFADYCRSAAATGAWGRAA